MYCSMLSCSVWYEAVGGESPYPCGQKHTHACQFNVVVKRPFSLGAYVSIRLDHMTL